MKRQLPSFSSLSFKVYMLLLAAGIAGGYNATGQTASITGSNCSGNTLTLTSSFTPSKIIWKLNGAVVDTAIATFNTSGITIVGGGTAGTGATQLNYPIGLFIDDTGNVYVGDYNNNRVQKFAPGSTTGVTIAGTGGVGAGATQLDGVTGVFVDGSGNLYVSDYQNSRVQKFTPGSTTGTTVAGTGTAGTGATQLNHPYGILVDGSGNLYVSDNGNNRVQKFTSGSTTGTTVVGSSAGTSGTSSSLLNGPSGIYFDRSGNLYVSDEGNDRVQKFAPGSTTGITVAGTVGTSGSSATLFNQPNFIFVDGFDNLFVSDFGNNRIQEFTPGSTTGVTVAGTGVSGSGATQFNATQSIFIDPNGNLYVADPNNNRIQEFTNNISATYSPSVAGTYTTTAFAEDSTNITTASFVVAPASILANQSYDKNIWAGDNTTFYVATTGGTPAYQWQVSTGGAFANVGNTAPYSGGTIATLSITSATISLDGSQYRCIITGGCTPDTSTANTLHVAVAPTITGGSCSGGLLTLNSTIKPSEIIWNLNGAAVDTTDATYSAAGVTVAGTGTGGSGATQLNYPQGFFIDGSGNLYVSDFVNNRVQKFAAGSTTGVTVAGTGIAGTGATQLDGPTGIVVDASGNIYVSDYSNNRIQKFASGSTSGSTGTTIAGSSTGTSGSSATLLARPFGIVFDDSGNLYVADYNNNRVQKFAPGSTTGTTVAGSSTGGSGVTSVLLNGPSYLCFDKYGNLYVADYNNNRVQKFAPGSATGTTVAGSSTGTFGSTATLLGPPEGVYVDGLGNLFVGDFGNNRVQKFAPGSTTGVTIAGNGQIGSSATEFSTLSDLFIDPNGNLYVSDPGNARIQKFTNNIDTTYTTAATGTYTASVIAADSTNITTAPLTVGGAAITLNNQSYDKNIWVGDNTTFYVATTGGTPTYQWQVSTGGAFTNVGSAAPYSGGTTATLSITNATATLDGSQYRCIITGGCTPDTSTVNTLHVMVTPTITGATCAGGMLTLNSTFTPSEIIWNLGGTSVDTTTATYDTAGITIAGTGTAGSGATQLYTPFGIFVDAAGNKYIVDADNSRVQKFAPGSTTGVTVAGTGTAGNGPTQLNSPLGLFVDGVGNIYVSDGNNNRIQKFAPGSATGVTVAGSATGAFGTTSLLLSSPYGICVDAAGNLYVADENNARVQKFTPGSTIGVTVAGSATGIRGSTASLLSFPTAVFVDATGNLYVSDNGNSRVQKFAPGSTTGVTVVGTGAAGPGAAQLNNPGGLFVDGLGNIYVADAGNNRIQKIPPGATTGTTIAGTGIAGSGATQFTTPSGVWVDDSGNVYVTDLNNERVQEFRNKINNTYTAATTGTYMASVIAADSASITTASLAAGGSATTLNNQSYDKNIWVGDKTTFYVATTGGTPTYQWQVSTGGAFAAVGSTAPYSGDTTATLSITNATATLDGSKYRCIITGSCTPDTSTINTLHVAAVPIITGSSCAGGTLTLNSTIKPSEIVWSINGTVDTVNTAFNTNGVTVTATAGGGNAANQFSLPADLFIDAAGNTYVADYLNARVQKFAPGVTTGVTVAGTGTAGTGATQLTEPSDVFVDGIGNLYVADYNNNRVQKFAPGSTTGITVAGTGGSGTGPTQLTAPHSICMDSAGNLYVSEQGNNRVQKFTPGSTIGVTVAGTGTAGSSANQLNGPIGVRIDAAGNLYVADQNNNRVQKFAPGSATGVTVAGSSTGAGGATASLLNHVVGIAIDRLGNLYVSDQNNSRIQKFASGSTTGVTVAGTGTAGSGSSQLISPEGIFVDRNGNLFVADGGNNRVEKFANNIDTTYSPSSIGTYTAFAAAAADSARATTAPFTVSTGAITLVNQSYDKNIWVGDNTTFYVAPTGSTPTYQWQVSAGGVFTNVTNTAPYSGATTATLSITAAAAAMNGTQYRCIVSGACIPDTSTINTLHVAVVPVIAGNNCSGGTFTLSSDITPSQIIWSLNDAPVDTVNATFNPAGITVAGTGIAGSGATQVNGAISIFVDAANNLYVADQNNNRVQKFASGSVTGVTVAGTGVAGSGATQLNLPNYPFVDGAGNLYVSDEDNNRVQKFAPGSATGITVAGTGTAGAGVNQLNIPDGLFVDTAGNLYVADQSNNRVQKFAPGSATGVTVAGTGVAGNGATQLFAPTSLFLDNSGNLYVADEGNNRVQKFAPGSTTGVTVAGTGSTGAGPTQLNSPNRVYVDGLGNIYVGDYGNNRVQEFAPGSVTGVTIVGSSVGTSGSGATQLNGPRGIFLDHSGNLYVADNGNNRIQKFTNKIDTTYAPSAAGTYTASVITTDSTNITTAQFTVDQATTLANQSYDKKVWAGDSTTFNVAVLGVSLTYQWQVSTGGAFTNVANSALYSGVATSTLHINGATVAMDGYRYQCIAGGLCSAATSNINTLRVAFTPAISGSVCAGSTLSWSSNYNPVQITWSHNGTPVQVTVPAYNTAGIVVAGTGGGGSGATQLSNPISTYVDAVGNMYVADDGNNRVQKFAPGSTTGVTVAGTGILGSGANQLYYPFSVFVDGLGNLFVADLGNNRVQKFAPGDTTGVTVAGTGVGGSAANQLNNPASVVVDAQGNLYVADLYNYRVQKYAPGSTTGVTVAGTGIQGSGANQLNGTVRVFVDSKGNLYAADQGNSRIQKFAPGSTTGVTVAGTGTAGSAANQLSAPTDMYVDGIGNLYVADYGNNRIQKFAPGSATGVTVAAANTPNGIFVDQKGGIYASEGTSNRVREFANNISTSYTPSIMGTYTTTALAADSTNSTSASFTVYPIPAVTISATSQNVCNNTSAAAISFTGGLTGTVYNWVNSNTSIGLGATGAGNIASFRATNTTTATATAVITVTPTANGCAGAPRMDTITVKPSPVLTITTPAQTICNSLRTTAIVFNSSLGSTSYAWSGSTSIIGIGATGMGNIGSFNAANTSNVAVIDTITAVATSNGCQGPSQKATIRVNPTPVVTASPSSQARCNNTATAAIAFTSTVSGTTFAWANNASSVGLAATGTGASIASFTASDTGTAPVTATIQVTPTANGCVGATQPDTIVVNPIPTVTVPATQSVCSGVTTATVIFTGSAVVGTTYPWSNNRTSIGLAGSGTGNIPPFTATNTGSRPVTGTITVTPTANGCQGMPETTSITVNPVPNAVLTPPSQAPVCNNATTQTISITGNVTNTTFSWVNNAPQVGLAGSSTGNIFSFTAQNSGTAPIVATITVTPAANGCTGTNVTTTITVNPTPTVTATPPAQALCSNTPAVVNFSGAVAGTTYSWANNTTLAGLAATGTGNVGFTAINAGTAPILDTITVTPAANGCTGAAKAVTITVNPIPVVTATPDSQAVCVGATTTRIVFSSATSGAQYTWVNNNTGTGLAQSGTGNIAAFTSLNGGSVVPLTSTIMVTPAVNGCTGVAVPASITVNPYPRAVASASANTNSCINDSVVLSANTNPGYTYQWSDNGATIANASGPTYPAHHSGSYSVAVNSLGCVTVSPAIPIVVKFIPPAPIYNAGGTYDICPGDSAILGTIISFTPVFTYQWQQNGNSNTGDTNVYYTAVTAGSYNVVVNNNGCTNTSATVVITQKPAPNNELITTAANNSVLCPGGSILMHVDSLTNTYQWYANSTPVPGATFGNYTATYAASYTVGITNSVGCTVFTPTEVISNGVAPEPLIVLTNKELCAQGYSHYQWFLNGTAITGATSACYNPGVQAGDYTVTAENGTGCTGISAPYYFSTSTGVATVNQDIIKLYPNPATNIVNVSAPEIVNISVSSLDGKQLIYAEHATWVDISHLANAVYMVQIYDTNHILLKVDKLVKSSW